MGSNGSEIQKYIARAPKERQARLRELYIILKKVVPEAKEEVKWRTPVFSLHRILFGFAGFKDHINFVPTAAALKPFAKDLKKFKTGKSTVQFPYDKPLPKALITKIARFRLKELKEKDARWM